MPFFIEFCTLADYLVRGVTVSCTGPQRPKQTQCAGAVLLRVIRSQTLCPYQWLTGTVSTGLLGEQGRSEDSVRRSLQQMDEVEGALAAGQQLRYAPLLSEPDFRCGYEHQIAWPPRRRGSRL
ncbi:MAG: hypothetical protein IPN42_08710 [Methylococcaceae bacterium]|nr:hypothetical protein [Methylococcaceae bacterium]